MSRRAFTLVEMLVALLVLGAVSASILFSYGKVYDNIQRTNALSKAKLIDASRNLYASDVADESEWTPLDTHRRITLLITKGYLGGVEADFTSLAGDYSVATEGEIRNRTSVYKGATRIFP